MQDQQNNIQTTRFLDIHALQASDKDSQVISTNGYDALTIYGAVEDTSQVFTAANRVDFTLFHGDTETTSDMTAVEAKDVVGYWGSGGVVYSLNQAGSSTVPSSSAGIAFALGYIGGKKYIYLQVSREGTVTQTPQIFAIAVQGIASYSEKYAKVDWD